MSTGQVSEALRQNKDMLSFTLCVCSYLQMADWLYAGPSAALSAWPT